MILPSSSIVISFKGNNMDPVFVKFVVCCIFVAIVRGERSFSGQIQFINEEVDNWYNTELNSATGFKEIFNVFSDSHYQSELNHWPKQMMRVLQVATGIPESNGIVPLFVGRIASGLKQNDLAIQQEFLHYFEEFLATKFESDSLKTNSKRDVLENQVMELCAPYIAGSEGYFNFQGAIDDLIRLKKKENVSDREFSLEIALTRDSITPLYEAAMICKVIEAMSREATEDGEQLKLQLPRNSRQVLREWPFPCLSSNCED